MLRSACITAILFTGFTPSLAQASDNTTCHQDGDLISCQQVAIPALPHIQPRALFFPGKPKWKDGIMRWYYNAAGQPSWLSSEEALTQIRAYMNQWSNKCGIKFNYLGLTTANISAVDNKIDNQTVLGWGPTENYKPGAGGLAFINTDSNNNLIDTDIMVDPRNCEEGGGSLSFATFNHEIGHAIGLEHSDTVESIMYANPYHSFTYQTVLRDDDIAGCISLYGEALILIADFSAMIANGVVTLDASKSIVNNGGSILSYQWTSSDGQKTSGKTATLNFLSSGNYTITLVITDSNGMTRQTSQSIDITVGKVYESDFTDNGDGTVTHNKTGLTWKRCPIGQTYSGGTCDGTAQAYSWYDALAVGPYGWGIPTTEQLNSIIDSSNYPGAINLKIFPLNTQRSFWNSSPYPYNPFDTSWIASLGPDSANSAVEGSRRTGSYSGHYFVLQVRGGASTASPPVTLLNVNLNCQKTINSGATGICSATASYSNSTSKAVTPTFSSSNSAVLSVNASGNIIAGKPSADTTVTVTASYSEGGVNKTATTIVTVKAPACSANTGKINIGGSATKKPGEPLDVRFQLCGFNSATYYDVYAALQLPNGALLFLSSPSNASTTPSITPWDGKSKPAVYIENTLLPDQEGSLVNIPVLPTELPRGIYTFYGVSVLKGGNVLNSTEWVSSIVSGAVTLGN